MKKLVKIKARDLKPNPSQVRKPRTETELRVLGSSVIKRQLVPLIIRPDNTVLDGDGRREGVMLIDPDFELESIATDEELTPAQATEVVLITALHRTDLKPYETFLACNNWMEQNKGGTVAALAEIIDLHRGTVGNILSLAACIPVWHEAAEAGRVGISDWSAAAKLDERGQHELLEMKLRGASAHQLQSHSRQKRNGHQASSVKKAKIKIELPSGVTVTFSGKEMSLNDAIEAAALAHKALKKGQEDGLTAKTFERVCRDKAAKEE
jgi:ParB family transcriptional regulator, chromosome partitioning protein